MRQQAVEESSQVQSTNLPHEQGTQGDRPLGTKEEVSQSRSRHRRRRPERPSLRAEDDDRRPPTRSRTNTRRQVVEESSQAQSPNLPHGQSTQGDRPLGTEEEVSQWRSRHQRHRLETPALRAEDVEKLAEKANIIGCNDQVTSSAFKKGLPTEHELYSELAVTPSQTLAEVFATAERYALWDDDRIAAKKASEQVDHSTKQANQKSNQFEQKARDKHRLRPQERGSEIGTFIDFTIPIHQILAQVKDKPWVRRQSPMKRDPSERDTSKYWAFYGEHGHYTNNCNTWKRHLEELIEDRDAAAKEPPKKVIRINTILADSQESGLTTKERKRKIAQATYISQVTTGVPVIVDTPIIGFQKKDLIGLDLPYNDALVIRIQIEQAVIERDHMDEGSAANILQLSVIQQIGLELKISKLSRSLTGFNRATSITVGTIDLDVHSPLVVCSQTFMVIDEISHYNGILG
ncbi:uncharacterized protein LOC109946656 [Prunus persica]|uniref:uncharacterized protein LOC109946656 n=1 Tax=Prunus persica TaxID=3760 RepID=UPI0009AB47FC|nr:uncharacterized protein LOC109946656 [Prunus persica]